MSIVKSLMMEGSSQLVEIKTHKNLRATVKKNLKMLSDDGLMIILALSSEIESFLWGSAYMLLTIPLFTGV